jgi:diguanylate cyclase
MDLYHFAAVDIPLTTTLAMLVMLGYVFGTLHQRRKSGNKEHLVQLRKDLARAALAVNELGKVIRTVRNSTAKHYTRLKKIRNQIARMETSHGDAPWQELCQQVEGILDPTLQLVSEIANAQERIRYQSSYLMTFSELRTDPLTGLGNRRALDHVLSVQFNILKRYGTPFSMAVIDIDHFKELNDQSGHQHGDQMLCELKDLILGILRAIDVVARFGGDELVVVMPHTDVHGAAIVGERLRAQVEWAMPLTISIGVASASPDDTPESLFQRADAALYRAKNGGRNCLCRDPGETEESKPKEAASPETATVA